jgi:ribose transport system substrate-binding protein
MIGSSPRGVGVWQSAARRSWRAAVLAASLSVVALGIAACGSSSNSSGSSSAGTTPASVVAAAKAAVAKGYGTGYVEPPPTTGPTAQKGKNVWWISCGQIYPSCVSQSDQFVEAAKVLGWHVTVVDGKASSTTASALIRQAIAAHVDGIGIDTYDCPGIKGALEAAKAAKIPTVSFAGYDCNSPIFHGTEGPALFTAVVKLYGEADPAALFSAWGKMLATFIVAHTNGKATFFYVNCTDNTVCVSINQGFQSEIKLCTGCHEINVPYSFADVPNPATQEWKSALLAHPTVNAIQFVPAGLLADGLQAAITGTGHSYTLYGGEGSPQDYGLIREGKEVSSIVRQDAQGIWATADTLNRIFAGENPATFPNEGSGFQIVDKTHNLPASGTPAPARDFEAVYEKLWTGN